MKEYRGDYMSLGKTNNGLLNDGGTFLSPQEVLAKAGSGGGSALPTVTDVDDGKGLLVEDGEWSVKPILNGVLVNVTYDTNNSVWKMDKTFREIYDLLKAGVPCFAKVYSGNDTIDGYAYNNLLSPISVYKYNVDYRVFFASNNSFTHYNDIYSISCGGIATFVVTSVDEYPIFARTAAINTNYATTNGNMQ